MLPEGARQPRTAAHAVQRLARLITELGEAMRTEVGQVVLFPIAPDVLHQIELRGVVPTENYKSVEESGVFCRHNIANLSPSATARTVRESLEKSIRGSGSAGISAGVGPFELAVEGANAVRASSPCSSAARIRRQAKAEGRDWPFSHRLMDANDTPSDWASWVCVKPSRPRSLRIRSPKPVGDATFALGGIRLV